MRKPNMTQDIAGKTVSASDVENYGYCPLSWWLSEQDAKEEITELKKGSEHHAKIGDDVVKIKKKEKFGQESEKKCVLVLTDSNCYWYQCCGHSIQHSRRYHS